LDNSGGEITIGLIPTHAAVEHEDVKLEKSHTIGPYGLSMLGTERKRGIGASGEFVRCLFD
jgi:hypothetical protein